MQQSPADAGTSYQIKPKSPRRLRRWVRRIFLAMALLVVGAGLAHGIWGWREQRAFDALIERYRAANVPITAGDFAPARIPDADNAAVVLAQAAKGIDINAPTWERLGEIQEFVGHPMTESEVQLYRQILSANADALAAPAKAAGRPAVQWDVSFNSPVLVNLQLTHLNEQRSLARLLAVDATIAQHDGDFLRALRRVNELLQISRAVDQTPTLICHLVAIGISSMACDTAVETAQELGQNDIKIDKDLRRQLSQTITQLLDTTSLEAGRRNMWTGERMMALDAMAAFADGRLASSVLVADGTDGQGRGSDFASYVMRPLALSDGRLMADYFDRAAKAMDATDLPTYRQIGPDVAAVRNMGRRHLFARILLPSFGRAVLQDYRAIASRRMAALALASRLYSADHKGELPVSLEDLVPKYMPNIPADPITARLPLVYNRDAAIVYSVGENEKDDKGRPVPQNSYRQRDRENTDDVVHLKRQARPEPLADDSGVFSPADLEE